VYYYYYYLNFQTARAFIGRRPNQHPALSGASPTPQRIQPLGTRECYSNHPTSFPVGTLHGESAEILFVAKTLAMP
jgi:hypothetical protein